MIKDVTHTELFETLLYGEIGGAYYDLHNDFSCIKFTYNADVKELELRFVNDDYKLIITFRQSTLAYTNINPGKSGEKGLELFYRGRFERNNNMHEMSESGEYFFYMLFRNGDAMNILARQAAMELSLLNS